MGKRKRAVIVEDDDVDDLESQIKEEEKAAEAEREIEGWLSDFQNRFTDQPVKVQVDKFETGEWLICRKYPLATFDHESVRDEFGGGKYRATLFDPNGKYVKGGRNTFSFAAPLTKKPEDRPQDPLANPVMVMLLKSQEENSKNMMQLTQAMITAQAGKPAGGGIGELIEALVKMQTLAPKPENPLSSFKETLGMMKLVKEVTGDGDEKSGGIMSEIKEFLELAPLLKEKLPEMKAMLGPRNAQPAAPTPAPGGAPPMDPVAQRIVMLIPKFVGAARTNAPVPQWSEFLLDAIEDQIMPVLLPQMKDQYGPLIEDSDDVYEMLIKYAKNPEYREKIYAAAPPLAPYKVWCDQVIETALRSLTEEENGGNVILDAVEAPGNGSHDLPDR